MKTQNSIHLLLRFSNSLLKDKDTIEEYNKVVERAGAVWLGKMGSPVSQAHIDLLMDQIKYEFPTYIYLVKQSARSFVLKSSLRAYVSRPVRIHSIGTAFEPVG